MGPKKTIIKMKASFLFFKRLSVDRGVWLADKTHEGHVLILRVTVLKMTTQEALVSRTSFLQFRSQSKMEEQEKYQGVRISGKEP